MPKKKSNKKKTKFSIAGKFQKGYYFIKGTYYCAGPFLCNKEEDLHHQLHMEQHSGSEPFATGTVFLVQKAQSVQAKLKLKNVDIKTVLALQSIYEE